MDRGAIERGMQEAPGHQPLFIGWPAMVTQRSCQNNLSSCVLVSHVLFSVCVFSPRKVFKNRRTSTAYSHVPRAFPADCEGVSVANASDEGLAEGPVESLLDRSMEGQSCRPTDTPQGLVLSREGGWTSWGCGCSLFKGKS